MTINDLPNPCPWWCTSRNSHRDQRPPDGAHFSVGQTSPLTLRKPGVEFDQDKQSWSTADCFLQVYALLEDQRAPERAHTDDTGAVPRVVIDDSTEGREPSNGDQEIVLSVSDARALAEALLAVADMIEQKK